jgi:hypothetical protein
MASYWLNKRGVIASKPASLLSGKTPAEAVLTPETRRLLREVLNDPSATVSPDLHIAAKQALRHLARRTAPFLPLSPEHRLGWLWEFPRLECRRDWPGAFTRDYAYRHYCHDVATRRLILRKTPSGGTEEVLVSGVEMLVRIHASTQSMTFRVYWITSSFRRRRTSPKSFRPPTKSSKPPWPRFNAPPPHEGRRFADGLFFLP